ncbi:T9SS type A sorting domain-containing protein [Pseudoflavitalea sp. G-6-1-2]|uniref:T9SS type A sorting domain-containing protein n=1 Tax=Pseudoflavitalea sp. G-6-1-2 TaxID=2728841 RepID=UPI00146CB9C6|nr:T9SS type A sorting domain-containing protein [Pseudoflavitalea sp. G-6-1-2]NML21154.1 T9SS type A sorting domain-containing protein [Pseudoflavitalea sp. G-6-1-2]
MKQIFTCLVFLCALLKVQLLLAAAPTVTSSKWVFSPAEGSRIGFSFTAGNGNKRIIVIKEGSAVSGLPENGKTYFANSSFATTGTGFTAPGEFVVADGSYTNLTVTNLSPGKTYHIAIFEYNGTGATAEFLMTPAISDYFTVSAPTSQATTIGFSNITGTTAKLDIAKGDGTKRIVVMRKDNAVTQDPTDLTYYTENANFGSGSTVGTGNYTIMSSAATSVTTTGLEPNTTYHVAIYEYNGGFFPMFLKPALRSSFKTAPGPASPPTKLSFSSIDGDRHIVAFSNGGGTRRLVIGRKGAPVSAIPINGEDYQANPSFGSGPAIKPGEFVLSNSGFNSLVVSNLEPNTVYHYAVFEFDGTGTNTYYLTSSYLTGSGSTAVTPTRQASGLSASNITGTGATLTCAAGDGGYRLFVVKEGSAVDADPTDLKYYNSNTAFGSAGSAVTPGNFAVSSWNNNSLTVSNLKAATTYHVAVWEYNGMYHPAYARPPITTSFTTPSEPTNASAGIGYISIEGNYVYTNWSSGNGARRIVIAKKGSAVTAKPTDGATYNAQKVFGTGTAILPGEFVVYDGSSNAAEITTLDPNSTYHLAIFDYNLTPAGQPDYLLSSFATSSFTTLKTPADPSSNLVISGIQNNQATFTCKAGSGYSRMAIVRETAVAAVEPEDLKSYTYGTYGTGTPMGPGNYVVTKTTGITGIIYGLQPGTNYTVTLFEYNGNTGPMYLRPGTSVSFTTAGTPPLTTPVTPATKASVSAVEGNAFSFSFKKGSGTKRLVVMKQGSAVSFTPADGSSYTANANFGSGTAVKPGEYIVYNNNGESVDITNLQPNQPYHLSVFEYNTDGTGYKYLTSSVLTANFATAAPPSTGATDFKTAGTGTSLTITINKGSGQERLIVAREGSAITASPADLSAYPASDVMTNGSQLETGSYVVYAGSSNTVTVTNLTAGKKYYFSVFEYNGSKAPVYNRTEVLTASAIAGGSLPLTWKSFTANAAANGIRLNWATTQEINTARFEIERSDDGTHYTQIGQQPASGNSNNEKQYSFTDLAPQNGRYLYRIRQVDIDGASSYSKIVSITYKQSSNEANASVYPNPAKDNIVLYWPGNIPNATLSISDASGKLISIRQIRKGENISIAQLHPGLHYLVIRTTAQQYSLPLIKF